MARLWALLHGAVGGAGGPMLAVQLVLYWLGFGLIAEALVATGRGKAAVAVLILAMSPLTLGWQTAILKDSQMLGALLAAFGFVAAFRLRGRSVPPPLFAAAAILVGYATLVRANAAFAVAPLVVLLSPWPGRWPGKCTAIVALTLVTLAVSSPINHRLLGAEPSGVEKTQPLFDLAAIGVRDAAASPFTTAELAAIRDKHCVKSFFWDPLGDSAGCEADVARLEAEPPATLYRAWAGAIIAHPLAYAAHRLAHWNSTERWLVPPGLIDAEPPRGSEPNTLGLAAPSSPVADAIQRVGAMEAGTPLGWPILWTFLSLCAFLVALERQAEAAAGLALALSASAFATEASFLIVSIASDLRYHLWAMTATALALILLGDGPRLRRAPLAIASLALVGLIAVGLEARETLPAAPGSYAAMVAARTG